MSAINQKRLDDGFSTLIQLENIPTVELWEKEVTPPSLSANGPIDTTTMRNTRLRTMAPKQLVTVGKAQAVVAYATIALDAIMSQLGVNQRITIFNPDGSTYVYWGWINEFTPGTNKEGDQPTATVSFEPSNTDLDGNEVAPLYTPTVESASA